ncbi:hypothetical protein [Flavobacterium caeni]|uniref:DUF4136 domain-containing protein n=1 Tax=Flavobacterium caeni TaxID=490189 RepID=A0A1G5H456_9FLAO|nr:hypothetical protein [Flavobacterium caeni]SCY58662.1 hypothetical protein SAMN02927903_01762 [Flavobacterium caeni]
MKKIAFTIGMFWLLTGCATKVASNKATDFTHKITKLYIVVKGTDSAEKFLRKFTENFTSHLTASGIEHAELFMDPLSLESDEDVHKKIQAFAPNLVMTISQTESRRTTNGGYNPGFHGGTGFAIGGGSSVTGGTFDIKMFTPGSTKPVWRGNLKADAQFGLASSASKANEKLIKKLIEDGLLEKQKP